ncbi:tigger transposable element-derived protein 3-like isoform X2 [Pectinophora gossypiella]|uniref:tigger transposable element-derived protein 3-like isoform X2 n=1 Tax=Pectinophora gossypiella TaxID=13191 RepID=UPI00214E4BFE|nr:tigger transposable element-derived protein 3-like isoform X2 [Pectinophora gossypiella]
MESPVEDTTDDPGEDPLSLDSVPSNGARVPIFKRKIPVGKRARRNDKKSRISEDGEDKLVIPEVFVKVEVNEIDEPIAMDLDKKKIPRRTSKRNKTNAKKKKKKKEVVKMSSESEEEVPEDDDDEEYHEDGSAKNNKPLVCKVCGRRFSNVYNLRRHVPVHEGQRKCPLCGVVFKSKNSLTKHMAVHEPTEKCDICSASFHTKSQLEDHKNKQKCSEHDHTEERLNESLYRVVSPTNLKGFLSREELSYSIQNAIVSKMHKGRSVADICRLYAVTPEIVNEIWNDRDKFILPKKVGKRSVKYMNSVLEPHVLEWYNTQKEKGIHLTGRMFQTVAEAMARDQGFVHFNAGNKWLEQFKKKHNIYLNKTRRDYSNMNQESVWKTKFFQEQWSGVRTQYTDDEIYTADEVGVYYNTSKSRVRKLGGKKFLHGDPCDRLSILLCSNMSGTDKRKLLVCGTEDPLKHSCRHAVTLPVEYKRHNECHFTTGMFEDYVTKWNAELALVDKKALLILDRASIHSKLDLSNLKLIFIPWKSANSLMPIKNGVYVRFREEYRNLILFNKVTTILKGVDRNLTCLEALAMLDKAWNRTPPSTITKSFMETGYDVQNVDNVETETTNSENYGEHHIKILKDFSVEPYFCDLFSLDMYLTVDEDLLTGQGTNPSVFGGNHKVIDPIVKNDEILPLNSERPLSNEKELLLKKTRALTDLEIVRKYLLTNDTTYNMYSKFMDVEKVVIDSFVRLNN